jgi:hypothetical protein
MIGGIMLVNLTPHEVTLVDDQGNVTLVVKPEETSARVQSERKSFLVPGLGQVNQVVLGEVSGLPEYQYGVWLIVSRMVAERLPERADLIIPDETVRDSQGKIVGCKSFATMATAKAWEEWQREDRSYSTPDWWGNCDDPSKDQKGDQ